MCEGQWQICIPRANSATPYESRTYARVPVGTDKECQVFRHSRHFLTHSVTSTRLWRVRYECGANATQRGVWPWRNAVVRSQLDARRSTVAREVAPRAGALERDASGVASTRQLTPVTRGYKTSGVKGLQLAARDSRPPRTPPTLARKGTRKRGVPTHRKKWAQNGVPTRFSSNNRLPPRPQGGEISLWRENCLRKNGPGVRMILV